jgi:hypothetical protein
MKMTLIGLLLLASFNSIASSMDVVDMNKKIFVKITKVNDDISFEKCQYRNPTKCSQIGNQPFYTLNELRNQRSEESNEVIFSALGDVALTAGVLYGGAFYLIGIGAAESGVASSMLMVATAGTPVLAGLSLDALNPIEQYKQKETIEEEVILDKLVKVENISKFIKRLETVLNKIND